MRDYFLFDFPILSPGFFEGFEQTAALQDAAHFLKVFPAEGTNNDLAVSFFQIKPGALFNPQVPPEFGGNHHLAL
jgi:hypothetical protein